MAEDSGNTGVCFTHPGRRAIAVCTKCGAFLCPDCVSKSTSSRGDLICHDCLMLSPERETVAPPWENRRGMGSVRAFFATWRAVVFNSRAFFYSLSPFGPVFKPVLYAIICMAIGLIGAIPSALQSAATLSALFDPGMIAAGIVLAFVIIPPLYAFAFAVTVIFLHLLARGLGGSGNISATARAVSYAQSASIAEVIPIIGGLLALLLRLFFYGRGVPAVHKLPPVRAFSFYIILSGITFGLIFLLFRLATSIIPPSLIS
jgi:hypothetical protein